MSDGLENRLRRALEGRPANAAERELAESWQALAAALGQFPAVDAESLAGDVLLRIAADRRRRRRSWAAGGTMAAAAAALLAVAWWPPNVAAADVAWNDRLDPVVAAAEALLADANRPATPVEMPNPATALLARAEALAEQWERETL